MADLQGALSRLDETIERKFQMLNHPGLAIGITNCERLLFVGTYGMANRDAQLPVVPETLFQIGSISKAFTSIALLQLQEQGLLKINDPVTKYLPWFEVQSEYGPITLRHLMSHTAGIIQGSDATPSASTEAFALRFTKATAPPGERFHYSNSGYKVLGFVLETILGLPIADILRDRLLTPLGMMNTEPTITNAMRSRLAVGYSPFYDDRPQPRGGLLVPATWLESDTADGAISSTAEDMCRYLRSLLNRGEGLLLKESFEQLIEPIIPTDDGLHGEHYGLGLSIKHVTGNHIISHSGGMVGYMAHMLADLDSGFGVIALSNSPYDPENIANMAWEYLIAALKGNEIPEVSEVDPYSVKNIEDYAGRFRCGNQEFSLCEQGEHLYLEFQGDSVLLEPTSPDVFLVPHPVFELFLLRFKRLISSSSQEIEGRRETKRNEGGTITKALHGSDIYRSEGVSEPPEPENLPEWDSNWNAYPGHYRSHNPWYTNIRVVLRKGELILIEPSGDEEPLYPLEPGLFRVGADPRSPEFIRFEVLIDGKAMQVNLSGGVYSRTFTP